MVFLIGREMKIFVSIVKTDMNIMTFHIEGMNCNHCRSNVEKAIRSVKGVEEVIVDLHSGEAKVVGDGFDDKELIANFCYNPSYISFEYALSFYGIIPEYVSCFPSAVYRKKNNNNSAVQSCRRNCKA